MRAFHTFTLGTYLRFCGILIMVVVLIWYVHFQARNFLTGPTITLDGEYVPAHSNRIISLKGAAKNIVKLSLNGAEIYTDEHGLFMQQLILENGYTIMTLTAQDRFGRMTSLMREYVYVPQHI